MCRVVADEREGVSENTIALLNMRHVISNLVYLARNVGTANVGVFLQEDAYAD